MESHLRVAVVPRSPEPGFIARINGAAFPVVDVAVQTDDGTPLLSLVLAPDSLSIGDPSAVGPAPEVRPAAPQVASWGDGSQPDPREGIPGWEPTLGEQVAGHAERVSLRTWEPSRGQEPVSAFKRLVRLARPAVTA